ncbi:hypothetical protein [Mucilaginibacter mali]|nr:hypothetical protein [Mucilaginibacter mali]
MSGQPGPQATPLGFASFGHYAALSLLISYWIDKAATSYYWV